MYSETSIGGLAMAWREVTALSLRVEFVGLAMQDGANISELCRRYGISRKTGYKWLERCDQGGIAALIDRSRRPLSAPGRTGEHMEQVVVDVRKEHPAWGGRKIRSRLVALGHANVPAPSTITEILRRHGLLDAAQSAKHCAWQRFEHAQPNDLWQMDFKGDFATDTGRCYPLTVLDDHSRFSIVLAACADQRVETVKSGLIGAFERYGLPSRMLMDNGSPWSGGRGYPYTPLTVWLIRLGVNICHGRPYHPQTQGKEERFHRTLKAELLAYQSFKDIEHAQLRMDRWRDIYNQQRPHESLGMDVPMSRYRASSRAYPAALGPIEYGPDDIVRKVQQKGVVSFQNREWLIGRAFYGYAVALRHTLSDGVFDVYFCHQKVAAIDLTKDVSGYTKV